MGSRGEMFMTSRKANISACRLERVEPFAR